MQRATAGAITITHADRVVYPGESITKGDVAAYYQRVMTSLLPNVVKRPLSVIRCPEGARNTCFFQKHPMGGLHHVGTIELKEEKGSLATYMYAKNASSILELVQFGAMEFHVWSTRIDRLETTDRVVFDLDPSPRVTWERIVAAARLLKVQLDELELTSFVRTSGGKGLHVVLPVNPACSWDLVKDFSHAIATRMATGQPQEFVDTASKTKRAGKIYVDYLRNTRGATSIANYSLRTRKNAPVATPLRWEELSKIEGGDAFTIRSLPRRLSRLRKDPWENIDSVKQTLSAAMKKLEVGA
ncbi:non-homologous end-joining DNA ligase [Dyella dinghuensis]|uniref:non-homologous end-joining DNA ligase n=1 Tax=Dyella dinghuensis TaxID=1920169 RepID=UPI001F48B4E0|nr:non-homologous end-joining DNA ligase [Dyella dinghuensis]